MHEYTLHEEELKRCQTAEDYYVLYKVYKKSGPGPKNGEQYGAPFKEEEWADDEFLDVESCFLDQDHTSKIFNEIVSTDKLKVSNQIQSPIKNIDEIINKNVDDPAGPQLPNTDPALALTQVYDELPRADISFNGTNISERSVLLHPNSQQYGVDYSFDLTKSTTQFIDTREVASTSNIFEQDFIFTGDDFIEMDDLIGQEPTLENPSKNLENLQSDEIVGLNKFDQFNGASMLQSGIGSIYQETVSNADMNSFESYMRNQYQLPGGTGQLQNDNQIDDLIGQGATLENPSNDLENLQFDEIDGLSEFDPFSDASMLLSGIGSIDEGTVSIADMNSFESYMRNQSDNQLPGGTGQQLHSQLWADNLKGDFLNQEELNTGAISIRNSGGAVNQNNSANISAGANQNHQTVLADDDDQNWFTSTLWAFVESIPTTPADACESALVVNRAFERMSSFSRVKVNAATTTSSKVTGEKASNNRVFFLVSFLVVLFAIFWVLMNGKNAL